MTCLYSYNYRFVMENRFAVRLIFAFSPFLLVSLERFNCSTVIFNLFQIIMVSIFLARHDQYFIMFKDSNAFEFTNFPFKTKYINTAVYSVNRNYLFLRGKQEKKKLSKQLSKNLQCIY